MTARRALIVVLAVAAVAAVIAIIRGAGDDGGPTDRSSVPGRAIALANRPDGGPVALVERTGDDGRHTPAIGPIAGDGKLDLHDLAAPIGEPAAIAAAADGAVVVAGTRLLDGERRPAVTRVSANGAVDRSFGVNGVATLEVGSGDAVARGVSVAADGRIVVVADASDRERHAMAIARLDARNGRAGAIDLIAGADAGAAAADRDGTIIAAGTDLRTGSALIARVRENDPPDVTRGERFRGATWRAVATSRDGEVVVVGSAREDTRRSVVAVQRFDPNDRPAIAEIAAVGQGDGFGAGVQFGPGGELVVAANGSENDAPAAFVVKRPGDGTHRGATRRRGPGRVAGVTPEGGMLTTHWDGERQLVTFTPR